MEYDNKSLDEGHVLPAYTFRRRHVADVPEDVDDWEHFNDPNYDVKSIRSFETEATHYELDEKKERTKSFAGSGSVNYSSGPSEFDTESQLGTTTHAESSAGLREIEYDE
jgi:hypothetical protein